MTPPIAIIGAGPCGLTLARLLEVNNIDFVVFDRDPSGDRDDQGGSLDIHEHSGQLALKKAGLFDIFKQVARYEDQTMKFIDSQGRQIFQKQDNGKEERPEIDRRELRLLLLNSVPKEKIRWNSSVQEVTREDDGFMAVRFTNGSVDRGFKLVVGTDGAWSKVRPLINTAKPKYSGRTYLQTWISPSNTIHSAVKTQVGHGTCIALGQGKQLIAQRMGDGTYSIYAGIPLPEEWSRNRSDATEFNQRCQSLLEIEFADWSPKVTRWIKQGDGNFYAWSLYAMPTESLSWQSIPGVTLAGDAAHLTTPSGEGVNCAMHDSLQLAQAIVKRGPNCLDEAVAEYEQLMLPRAVNAIRKAEEIGSKMNAEDAAEQFKAMFTAPSNTA